MRLSAIGDVCHAVAMVRRIQAGWPETEITWVIGKIEYQLVRNLENIQFVIFDKKEGKVAVNKLREYFSDKKFDALLMMQVAFRANWVSRVIKADVRLGFDWARSKELHWLFANKRVAAHPQAHVLEGFMDFADALGVPTVEALSWNIPIDDAATQWAEQRADEWGKFVVISPAASKAERNWLAERYAHIADYVAQKGYCVVLCGGPAQLDRDTANAILAHTNTPVNLVGETNLHQLLAVLKRAQFVIAPDTGPAHMATTVGTPVIGLYAHSNPRRTGPYLSQHLVASVYEQCIEAETGKSWQQQKWGIRAHGKELMAQISVEQVKAKVDQVLVNLQQAG